jgi:hypothetical protein
LLDDRHGAGPGREILLRLGRQLWVQHQSSSPPPRARTAP